MKTAIWGTGNTTSEMKNKLCMISEMSKIMYGNNDIILNLQINIKRAEFIDISEYMRFLHKGMEELLQGMLKGENERRKVYTFCRCLEVLCSSLLIDRDPENHQEYRKEIQSIFQRLYSFAEQAFGQVYINCGSDMNEFVKLLLDESDIVLIYVPLRLSELDELFSRFRFSKHSAYYLVDGSFNQAMIPIDQMFRRYKELNARNTFIISYNDELQGLNSIEGIRTFLYSNLTAEKEENNCSFIREIMNVSTELSCLSRRLILGGTSKKHVVILKREKVGVS